jgi:hypothetical protein
MAQGDSSNDTDFQYTFYYTVAGDTGQETLSSYAMPISPLYFKPTIGDEWLDVLSDKRIVWDFGDGSKMEALTGVHVYEKPGSYKVRSYLYDRDGNGYYNTFSVTIDVIDFIQDRIILDVDKNTCSIDHLTGEVKNPINVTQYNSFRTFNREGTPPSIITHIDPQSFTRDYDLFSSGLIDKTYGHLLPSYTMLQTIDNIENVPISAVQVIDYDNIYAYASGGQLFTSPVEVEGSTFAGVSSTNQVYFRSDIPGIYNMYFGFEENSIFDFTNTTTYGVSAKICENQAHESLSITSNGIDGEGIAVDAFNIAPVKFACTDIPFVVKIKDDEGFAQKSLPLMELEPLPGSDHLTLDVVLTDGSTNYDVTFESDFNSISGDLVPGYFSGYSGGFFKGYFNFNTDTVIEDVYIRATTVYDGDTLVGTSSKFNIYPKDHYVVAKHGEDINFTDVFKDVAVQPLFTDSRMLINDFIGSIFGDIESAQDSIGKRTYEKIQNFTDNNSVIDYANIDQLAGILKSVNMPRINRYSTPPKVKRLLDLLSISQTRLFGDVNQNRDDFKSYGYSDNSNYGVDRCDPIPEHGVLFAGFDIVAFEKFSGKWTTLNTMLPLCASNAPEIFTIKERPPLDISTCIGTISCSSLQTETLSSIRLESSYFNICVEGKITSTNDLTFSTNYYSLSDYNASWGWPLTLDSDGTLFDVYEFYYKSQYDKIDKEGSVINFKDENTTIADDYSYTDWSRDDGVMSNIFANALYDGLDLFGCEEQQDS